MSKWPHQDERFTAPPVVVAVCGLSGVSAALLVDVPASQRIVLVVLGPLFLFATHYFLVTAFLRVFERLRPGGRYILLGTYYLSLAAVAVGVVLVAIELPFAGSGAAEAHAFRALQISAAIGITVAAKQRIERSGNVA